MANIYEQIKEAWRQACEFDNVDKHSMFVQFSDDNPHAKRHGRLVSLFHAAYRYVEGNKAKA